MRHKKSGQARETKLTLKFISGLLLLTTLQLFLEPSEY